MNDESGATFLAHSGKVGGGRAGIGKTAFLNHWGQDNVFSILFPDDQERDYIILGRIDEPAIRAQLAAFVHSVARFKEETVGAS